MSSVSVSLLLTAADAVQHAVFFHKSIAFLNLELPRCYKLRGDEMLGDGEPWLSYSKDIIFTKNKINKVHNECNLIYELNLDISQDQKVKFSDGCHKENFLIGEYFQISSQGCLIQICALRHFYINMICGFVDYACHSSSNNLKILKWFLIFLKKVSESDVKYDFIPTTVVNHFVKEMNPQIKDMDFVSECLGKLDFLGWIHSIDKSDYVENILFQVHRTGKQICIMTWYQDFIAGCLVNDAFQNAAKVLKCISTPKITRYFKILLEENIIDVFGGFEFKWNPNTSEDDSSRRYFLVLQVYWFFLRSLNPTDASATLALMWRSLPDVFLKLEEMDAVSKELRLTSGQTDIFYAFYCQAVGKKESIVEPRSLQHNCRFLIRNVISSNNHWLPKEISQIGLPPKLQRFVNLEL